LLSRLSPVERTLLVPLMARAWGARWHLDEEADACADHVLAKLGWHEPAWPDLMTWSLIVLRTRWFRQWAREFFQRHPTALGMNLGAGLSDYAQWVKTRSNRWIDADLDAVMQLRSRCLPPRSGVDTLTLDVCDERTWSKMWACRSAPRGPSWIMLEGVLMYCTPDQVARLLQTVGEHAPAKSELAFDVIPRWMVGWPVHVPHDTGAASPFRWGIQDVHELQAMHPRLKLQRVVSSSMPWSPSGWGRPSGWDPFSPYTMVRMSVHDGVRKPSSA
jgi:O-methyltransferase involved in polyketide biosynthesis